MPINVDSKVVSRILNSALFIGVVTYVSSELLERLQPDSLVSARVDWALLLIGGLCALISTALFAVVYREAQLFVQQEARWVPAALVAWISPLGKYLPGKIGSLVGAVLIYRRLGVGASVATAVLLMSTGSALSGCFFLLLPSVAMGIFFSEPLGAAGILAWIVMAAGLFFAVPRLFVLPVNLLLYWTGRAPLSVVVPFSRYLRLIFLGIVQLALAGTAFWLTANAVTDVAGGDWYRMTAAYTVAGVVGMFAFFAPGGLGVREGLLLLLLESVIEGPQLALTVILIRLNLTFCEVILALLGVVLWWSMSSGRGLIGDS
jgi:uncharacterized membrane protein YbhN (UPF0104 family)